jgi:WD40 repeat protein
LIRGDLDWIVMKAIDKDRTRRYATANELAADVERFLTGQPVVARPPSRVYKALKLVRRHRLAVGAAAATVAALTAGLAVAVWQYVEKKRAWEITLAAEEEKSRLLGEAQRAQASETSLRREAERQEREARQRTYAADINLAQQALAVNNLGRAQELLVQHRPADGSSEDLRGWEWRHLWQQCQSEAQYAVCQEPEGVRSLSVSADGHWVAMEIGRGSVIAVHDLRARREIARLNEPEESRTRANAASANAPSSTSPSPDTAVPPPSGGGGPGRRPFGLWEGRAAFAPVGDVLAFARSERTEGRREQHSIVLWKASDQSLVREVPLESAAVSLAFAPDGQALFVMTADSRVSSMDVSTGTLQPKWSLASGGWFVPMVRPSPDLQSLALAESGGRLRVVEMASGTPRWSFETGDQWARALAFSPDGKVLAAGTGSAGDSVIRLWDAATGTDLGRLDGHRGQISDLVFWPDGQLLASASEDHTIRLWGVAGQRPLAILRGHRSRVRSLALLPDGVTLLSAGTDGAVLAWDTREMRRDRLQFALSQPVRAWCFAPDSRSVLTLNPDGRLSRWHGSHFEAEEVLAETGQPQSPTSFAQFSDDGRLVAITTRQGSIVVWDVAARTRQSELKMENGRVELLGFIPGTTDVVTELKGPEDRRTRWDALTGTVRSEWDGQPLRGPQPGPGFSHDGRWLVTADDQGIARWHDLFSGGETELDLALKEIQNLAFSPDHRYLAAVSRTGTGGLWETSTRRKAAVLRGFLGGMHSAAFSPDSRRLAIGSSGEEAIKIYDLASQRELITLEGMGLVYHTTRFSPDGNLLASSNLQGMLSFWRAPDMTAIDGASAPR